MAKPRKTPLEKFIEAYERTFPDNPMTESCGQYYAACPVHGGNDNDSMSFTDGDDGRLLVTCHSQECAYEEIMKAVGLKPRDGFVIKADCLVRQLKNKRLYDRFTLKRDVTDAPTRIATPTTAGEHTTHDGPPVIYDYQDEKGQLEFQVVKVPQLDANGLQVGKRIFQRRPVGGGYAKTTKAGWFEPRGTHQFVKVAEPYEARPSPLAVRVPKPVRRVLFRLPELKEALGWGEPIVIVEGEKDVETVRALGFCATTNPGGAGKWHQEHTDVIAGADRVIIIPDRDAAGEEHARGIARALEPTVRDLRIVRLPGLAEGEDVSDWVGAGGTRATLEELIDEAPQWSPDVDEENPDEVFEILDRAPEKMTRPLSLIGDQAYLYTEVPVGSPRKSETAKVVVDGGGVAYSDHRIPGARLLAEIGFDVAPPADLDATKLLGPAGLKRLRAGERVEPASIFHRIVEAAVQFVDFRRSLGSEDVTAKLIALLVIQTYFLDAFHRIGYVWISGPYGSAKSKLLAFITRTAYLGEFLVRSSTYASLRDLAECGATLGIDDFDRLRDTDQHLRWLLLSGNTRGSTVTLKEQTPDKRWRNRRVPAFGFKVFTATEPPEQVIASRSIMIPLVPSSDERRTHLDPGNPDDWPCNCSDLRDDLWILGVRNLPAVRSAYRNATSDDLKGRVFDPWRPVLAVASWLESSDPQSFGGLYEEIHSLAVDYQEERRDIERDPIRPIFVTGLWRMCKVALAKRNRGGPIQDSDLDRDVVVAPGDLAAMMNKIASDEGVHDSGSNRPFVTPQKVGNMLGDFRFKHGPRTNQARPRIVPPRDVLGLADAFAMKLPGDPRSGVSGKAADTECTPSVSPEPSDTASTCHECQPCRPLGDSQELEKPAPDGQRGSPGIMPRRTRSPRSVSFTKTEDIENNVTNVTVDTKPRPMSPYRRRYLGDFSNWSELDRDEATKRALKRFFKGEDHDES